MLINKKITVLFIMFLTVIFLLPEIVSAQATDFGINELAEGGVNLGTRDLRSMISSIINIFLGFLGTLATLIILYAGFLWMTSGGNVDKITKAKRILINGFIGLVIILASYGIARFILSEIYDETFGSSGGSSGGSGFTAGVGLGAGALDSHYPIRYATDVPRNTNIYLTFKEPMDVSYIVADILCAGVACAPRPGYVDLHDQDGTLIPLEISYSTDVLTGFRTFQLNPPDLGNNTMDIRYTMDLGDLLTQNGSVAFPYSNSYSWIFTTGTDFDFTPPTVISVRPLDASIDNPRNSVVQINFSEAINPASATGDTSAGFNNISVTDNAAGPTLIEGEYKISNQYRTIELITTDLCGENSCGGEVFCLPVSADIRALVTDIVADMADNRLDGDDDGSEGGNYTWAFATNNEIDLTPPNISHMEGISDISLTDPIEITFDKELLGSSINSNNINLTGPAAINYWTSLSGSDVISINHDRFDPSSYYTPTLESGIKDLRQNCWFPCDCAAGDGSCVCTNNDPVEGLDCPGTDCVGEELP